MADQLPPNLDDAGLFLPSDIFLNDFPPFSHHYNPFLFSSCMDDPHLLDRQLASLSLLRTRPPTATTFSASHLPRPTPVLNSQRIKPMVQGGFGHGSGEVENGRKRLQEYGTAITSTTTTRFGSDPFYEFRIQPQVDGYQETRQQQQRPRTVRRQLLHQNHRLQNRAYPFLATGLGLDGGFVRQSAGTGVFHPRIVRPNTPGVTSIDVRKKQGMQNVQEIEVNSTRRVSVGKQQEECYYHLPPDMGLPQDWTY